MFDKLWQYNEKTSQYVPGIGEAKEFSGMVGAVDIVLCYRFILMTFFSVEENLRRG